LAISRFVFALFWGVWLILNNLSGSFWEKITFLFFSDFTVSRSLFFNRIAGPSWANFAKTRRSGEYASTTLPIASSRETGAGLSKATGAQRPESRESAHGDCIDEFLGAVRGGNAAEAKTGLVVTDEVILRC
jgi:hypothetical protein